MRCPASEKLEREEAPKAIPWIVSPRKRLVYTVNFPQVIRLMTRGDLPTRGEAELLVAALVVAGDRGS